MRTALVAALMLLSLSAVGAERLSGADISARTTLAFKVKDSAVAQLLPAGWVANPTTDGPNKGANLLLILVDSYFVADAAGTSTPPFHGMVLAVTAKKVGTDVIATMVVFGIAPDRDGAGPYEVFIPGATSIERSSSVSADGTTVVQEKWGVTSKAGEAFEFNVRFQRGVTARVTSQSRTGSGAKPDFYRIYHVDQVTDLIKSVATGTNRASALAFRATGPMLGGLFDGSEQLIGVTSTPVYSRTIYLPE